MLPTASRRALVLASGSRYRAAVLTEAGWNVVTDPPEIDERRHDDVLHAEGPVRLAMLLADAKADAVTPRHRDALVLAGDQVGVLDTPDGPVMLTKQRDAAGAVDQLLSMSGTTHRLVNALALVDTRTGRRVSGVDEQLVTMRRFVRSEAEEYVRRFEPFDTAGSYRIEDGEEMSPLAAFVLDVAGEDPSGVLGLPLPLLERLVATLTADSGRDDF